MDKSKLNSLEKSARNYDSKIVSGWERLYRKKRTKLFDAFLPYFEGGSALEMGIADGEMTTRILEHFDEVTIVDGSKIHLRQVQERFKELGIGGVSIIHSLFEEYHPARKFDAIFMTHILEHLDEPIEVLRKAKKWLNMDGRIFVAVPNSNSLHRHIGVALGMLNGIDSLNEQDKLLGHKRVYNPEKFQKLISSAGFSMLKFGGLMVKPLSNRQIEGEWSEDLIDAFFAISNKFPEICSEMYIIAELPKSLVRTRQ